MPRIMLPENGKFPIKWALLDSSCSVLLNSFLISWYLWACPVLLFQRIKFCSDIFCLFQPHLHAPRILHLVILNLLSLILSGRLGELQSELWVQIRKHFQKPETVTTPPQLLISQLLTSSLGHNLSFFEETHRKERKLQKKKNNLKES